MDSVGSHTSNQFPHYKIIEAMIAPMFLFPISVTEMEQQQSEWILCGLKQYNCLTVLIGLEPARSSQAENKGLSRHLLVRRLDS